MCDGGWRFTVTCVFPQDAAGSFIAAGGSGANEAKVFDRRNGNQLVGTVAGLTKAVFSLDWYQHRYLAIAGGDAAVRMFEVNDDTVTPCRRDRVSRPL